MARKSAQPTSDKECINVSMGAPLRFQSRLRSSYIYGAIDVIGRRDPNEMRRQLQPKKIKVRLY